MAPARRDGGQGIDAFVLDASAVLAYAKHEPGTDRVRGVLSGAMISAVNFAEVTGKLAAEGHDARRTGTKLIGLGLVVESFTVDDARVTGELAPATRRLGLSLADRACLALAQRTGRVVLTADRAMANSDFGVDVELIR